ncbi:MAG: nucleotidyltransferase family protein [Thermodesulfovibrionales bacterium]|jgi:hypothetical protein
MPETQKDIKILTHFSPEQQMLISTLHEQGEDTVKALILKGLDWNYILNTANEHGIIPLLYSKLKSLSIGNIPLNELKTLYLRNLQKNMAMTKAILETTEALETHGIRAVPFKGPVLSQQLYHDIGLRQSADIDLLIFKEHYNKAKEILLARGYEPQFKLNRRQEFEFLRYRYEMPFIHKATGLNIELHWNIAQSFFHFDLYRSGLWERLQPTAFAGKTVFSFSTEDMLLYLCFHGSKHGWERLSWIYDIMKIIKTWPLDWQYLLRKSDELDSRKHLLLGLHLAALLWEAEIPSSASEKIEEDPQLSALALYVLDGLFREGPKRSAVSNTIEYRLRLLKKNKHKLNHLLHKLFVPRLPDWETISLPDRLYFLYYFIRPLRLLLLNTTGLSKKKDD